MLILHLPTMCYVIATIVESCVHTTYYFVKLQQSLPFWGGILKNIFPKKRFCILIKMSSRFNTKSAGDVITPLWCQCVDQYDRPDFPSPWNCSWHFYLNRYIVGEVFVSAMNIPMYKRAKCSFRTMNCLDTCAYVQASGQYNIIWYIIWIPSAKRLEIP